jgi:hypothetical protein
MQKSWRGRSLESNHEKPKAVWPKVCSCGRSYDRKTWEALVYLGIMGQEMNMDLELRNCTCGNTISQPMTMEIFDVSD